MYSALLFFRFAAWGSSRCSLEICSLMLVNKKERKWVYWTCYREMLCAVYRSHQLITNKAQNRQGNCCTLWPALQLRNHPGQQKKKKDPSEQIAAIRMDAISWHCFKCQQQTRYSLGRWWWRGVFRWTRGGNTTADTTMGPNWEGRLASFSMSFTLFCFENMTRVDELWIFWTILKIIRHTSSHVEREGEMWQ